MPRLARWLPSGRTCASTISWGTRAGNRGTQVSGSCRQTRPLYLQWWGQMGGILGWPRILKSRASTELGGQELALGSKIQVPGPALLLCVLGHVTGLLWVCENQHSNMRGRLKFTFHQHKTTSKCFAHGEGGLFLSFPTVQPSSQRAPSYCFLWAEKGACSRAQPHQNGTQLGFPWHEELSSGWARTSKMWVRTLEEYPELSSQPRGGRLLGFRV